MNKEDTCFKVPFYEINLVLINNQEIVMQFTKQNDWSANSKYKSSSCQFVFDWLQM